MHDDVKGGSLTNVVNAAPKGSPLALQTCHWTGSKMRFAYLVKI